MPLEWCAARTAAHRSHLSTFRCADPEYSHFDEELGEELHDFAYEIEVQEWINGLHPPAHPPNFVLLGYANDRLAVVIDLKVQHFDRYCFIRSVAVANWARGHRFGREAVELVGRVMQKYAINSDYVVEAHIDPDNIPSQEMFAELGFEHVDDVGRYQRWARHYK